MHPFMDYQVALGIVEETLKVSERRWRWRRRETDDPLALPSWDDGLAELKGPGLRQSEKAST